MKILVVGGCGYIGACLVPELLADGHEVKVVDTQWFGRGSLPDNGSLTVIKADIRDLLKMEEYSKGQDVVICLAGITSEAMCQKDRMLAHTVNTAGIASVILAAKKACVWRFILASSAAAYGSSETDATEEHELQPTTIYGEHKKMNEGFLKEMLPKGIITRSASVCGYSPRQRFDLTVNKMVHDAIKKGAITVNGGQQKRCHIHMKDICAFYRLLLTAPEDKVNGQVFNVVGENQTVNKTAEVVSDFTGCNRQWTPRSDNRSYTVDGSKAKEVLGFTPKSKVIDAVRDLRIRFDQDAQGFTRQWIDSETNPVYQNMMEFS